jgi:hypothetical protein
MTIGLASNQASPEVTVNQMVDGYLAKSVAGASNVNLSDLEATWAVIELTGVLTGSINVTVPDVANTFSVVNSTSGAFTVTVKSLTGTGILVPQGTAMALFCDGTNVENALMGYARSTETLANSAQTAGGQLDMNDLVVLKPELKDVGYTHTAPASSSGTLTLDLTTGNSFNTVLTENVTTLTISNPSASGKFCEVFLEVAQDGTGSWTFAWPAATKWPGGTAPTVTAAASSKDMFRLSTRDSGTTWIGEVVGQNVS